MRRCEEEGVSKVGIGWLSSTCSERARQRAEADGVWDALAKVKHKSNRSSTINRIIQLDFSNKVLHLVYTIEYSLGKLVARIERPVF